MKKKLLIGFAALVLALVAAFNISLNASKSNLSMLSLANIEALAQAETGSNGCVDLPIHGCITVYATPYGSWTTTEYGRN